MVPNVMRIGFNGVSLYVRVHVPLRGISMGGRFFTEVALLMENGTFSWSSPNMQEFFDDQFVCPLFFL